MKVLFLGRGELGYTTLERLLSEDFEVPVIVTCDHSPDVGGSAEAFRKLAENKGIDYFHTNNINTDTNFLCICFYKSRWQKELNILCLYYSANCCFARIYRYSNYCFFIFEFYKI